MAKLIYDVIAKGGEYKDRDGNTKQRFHKCGVVFESDKGLSLKLESLPLVGFDGWLSLKVPQPKTGSQPAPARAPTPAAADDFGDDIPF